jgi:alpha-glucosidase
MIRKGYPMGRALWLHYPNDSECRKIAYQYLLGRDLLVTPVTKKGVTKMHGYLPEGEWISPYTKEIFKGGKYHMIPAKMGEPSVLIRKGSCVESELMKAIKG